MSITVQTIDFKNHFRETVGSFDKIVALDSFRVVFDDVLVDITGFNIGQSLHNFENKKGYIFKKISATSSRLQIRNITASSTTKGALTTFSSFPSYIVLKAGQTRTVPTGTTNSPDSITDVMEKEAFVKTQMAILVDLAHQVESENYAERWAREASGQSDQSANIPNNAAGTIVRKRIDNIFDRNKLLGLGARILKEYADVDSTTSAALIPAGYTTEAKILELMSKLKAEFNIPLVDWFYKADQNQFNSAFNSRKLHFSREVNTGGVLSYKKETGSPFFTPTVGDWKNLFNEFSTLRRTK